MREKRKGSPSNRLDIPMVRTPNASNTLIRTEDRLHRLLQLLPARLFQQVRLLQYLFLLQISDADGLLTAVDVVALDDRVAVRSG